MHYPMLIIANFEVDVPVSIDEGVLAASISFSVNLFRPYVRRPTRTIVSASSIPEKPPVTDNCNDPVSTSLPEPAHSPVSQDEIATDDMLDGSMVVVKNTTTVDEEIVKRRWYREEMRQSPVYDLPESLANDRNAMVLGLLRRAGKIVFQILLPLHHWNEVCPPSQTTAFSSSLWKTNLLSMRLEVETNLLS